MINRKDSNLNFFKNKLKILNNYDIPKNSILMYGHHVCKSALENKNRDKVIMITTEKKYHFWKKIVEHYQSNLKIIILREKELDHLTNKNIHQNIVLIAKPLKKLRLIDYLRKQTVDNQKIILLDQVTDPQNIGAIIRSAFAFGFNAVGLLKNHSPYETSSFIKASSGEIEKINLIELGNLIQEINLLKSEGFFTYGLSKEGDHNIKKFNFDEKKIALVVGSEGKGLRNLTKKNLDKIFHIAINDECNSINASNAAAIAMYQITN